MILQSTLSVQLEGDEKYLNITDRIQQVIRNFGVVTGQVDISVRHTTCALIKNEDEPCLLGEDLFDFLDRVIPQDGSYVHDDYFRRTVNLDEDRDERVNGQAHLRAMLLNPSGSLTLFVEEGKLALGQWQQILFLDFDNLHEWQERKIVVRIMRTHAGKHVNYPLSYDWSLAPYRED